MIEQYFVLDKRIDLYLPDPKLSIEVDEKGHIDTHTQKKKKRRRIKKNKIEEEAGCKFIRIDPDSEKFNISVENGKICNHINESNKKFTEELTGKSGFKI